jgi:dolichol-phosphate mannosyltransferase
VIGDTPYKKGADAEKCLMDQDLDLTVVVPVFNEEESCAPLMEELKPVLDSLNRTHETIFVDDGSVDRSGEALESLARRFDAVRVIRFKKNCGQTAAFEAGFEAARGKIIITMDGDMQNDPHDIPILLEKIESCDLVCGWREKRNDNLVRRISSLIGNGVRRAFTGDHIHDTGCSLKAFRSEYAKQLKLFTGMHRFFPALVATAGGRMTEVKVRHRPRRLGFTKYNIRNRMVASFVDLLAVCWMKKRWMHYQAEEFRK